MGIFVTMIFNYLTQTAAKASMGFLAPGISLYLGQAFVLWQKTGDLYIPSTADVTVYLMVSITTAYGVWRVPNK